MNIDDEVNDFLTPINVSQSWLIKN
jgi:hypothetical protein